jgi:hypothetical protein
VEAGGKVVDVAVCEGVQAWQDLFILLEGGAFLLEAVQGDGVVEAAAAQLRAVAEGTLKIVQGQLGVTAGGQGEGTAVVEPSGGGAVAGLLLWVLQQPEVEIVRVALEVWWMTGAAGATGEEEVLVQLRWQVRRGWDLLPGD